MKYKVNKGTETFNKIESWFEEVSESRNEAMNLVEELTGERKPYFPDDDILLKGGISAIPFKEHPGKLWIKRRASEDVNYYMPHGRFKAIKDVRERIRNLTKVSMTDLMKHLGLSFMETFSTPAVSFGKDCYLVTLTKELYESREENGDLIEVTHSEYEQLKRKVSDE